jgi:hypothetical protein
MEAMINLFTNFYAYMAIIPFIPFLIVCAAAYFMTNNGKKAIVWAMDITTFFLIGAVSVMYNVVFPSGLGGIWWIVLLFLITGGLIANMQNKLKGQIDPRRIVRAVWRLGFLFLSLFYVLLFIVGITQKFIEG